MPVWVLSKRLRHRSFQIKHGLTYTSVHASVLALRLSLVIVLLSDRVVAIEPALRASLEPADCLRVVSQALLPEQSILLIHAFGAPNGQVSCRAIVPGVLIPRLLHVMRNLASWVHPKTI